MLRLLAALAATSLASTNASSQAPTYDAEFLGPVVSASAMNESGRIVGSGVLQGGLRGWVAGLGSSMTRVAQPVTALPLPPTYASSFANDINEAGVIAGGVSPTSSPEIGGEAALWTPDGSGGYGVTLLGKLPGHVRSMALGLNDVGDVVGYSSDGTFRIPVLFAPGGPVDLSATGIFDPVSVNDQRVLVDSSFTAKRMNLDTMIVEDLGVPVGLPSNYLATRAVAINESGQVCGQAILTTSTSCDRVAARFTDGVGWQVFSGCGSANGAYDMNDLGDVVMRLNVSPFVRFEGLGTFRIEDLISEDGGHWFVINGVGLAIDGARRMAVPATNLTTGESGLVLLTPQPPTCQADLGFGGPGAMRLCLCGETLSLGNDADLAVTGAPPGGLVHLVGGLASHPAPFAGGTLVPSPVLFHLVLAADPAGEAHLTVAGGGGPASVYLQAVAADAGLAGGFALSNALRAELLP